MLDLVIAGQQAGDVISRPSSHDIGIVNLFAADLDISHQFDELVGDSSGDVRHLDALRDLIDPLNTGPWGRFSEAWSLVIVVKCPRLTCQLIQIVGLLERRY